MSNGFRYVYVVVDSFDQNVVEEGVLLLWDYKGHYYTITTFNFKTRQARAIANIVLLKKLTDKEKECLDNGGDMCECIDGFEGLLEKRLTAAKRHFPHLTLERLHSLKKRALAAGCREDSRG